MIYIININSIITLTKIQTIKMTQSPYKYPFEPASQDRFFNIEGYRAHMFKELMLARPDLFDETNNTIEKFAAKYPKVDIRSFRHGFPDKVSDKKALNEGIPRRFIKCNKNNNDAIAFVPTEWCDQNFWNQPEPLVELLPVIDVPVVEVVAETEAVLEEEEVVPPPNVSIPEPDTIDTPPITSNPNQKPPTKIFNGREYYSANELKEKYPQVFRGLKKGLIRDIIRQHDIPKDTECVYAMLVKKDWKLMSESVDKAKLFISKDWWDENMFKKSTSNDEDPTVKSKYDMAPQVIEVPENIMFKDLNGEPMPIEIRGNIINGQLDEETLYFNLDDTSKGFGIPNLYIAVINDDRDGYIENDDYKKFYVKNSGTAKVINDYICRTREIGVQVFLTYNGLLRVLMVSRTANSKKFRKWATHTLFTHQFGNPAQKQELASQLVGVSYSHYKMIFDTNASAFPCIYIIIIGLVSKLRKKYKIPERYPDNDLVLKFGYAKDFKKRLSQHSYERNYGHNIKVLHTQQIDVLHISSAETALEEYLYGRILDIPTEKFVDKENDKEFISEGKKELFVMSDTKADKEWLDDILNRIGENYAGRTKEFKHQLELKDKDIMYLNENNESLTKQLNDKDKLIDRLLPNRQN